MAFIVDAHSIATGTSNRIMLLYRSRCCRSARGRQKHWAVFVTNTIVARTMLPPHFAHFEILIWSACHTFWLRIDYPPAKKNSIPQERYNAVQQTSILRERTRYACTNIYSTALADACGEGSKLQLSVFSGEMEFTDGIRVRIPLPHRENSRYIFLSA